MKTAILQVSDTGPLESLVVMLRSVGYQCFLPDKDLRAYLRQIHLDTVVEVKSLVDSWGYDPPFPEAPLPEAGVEALNSCDLYVDVKAHRNGPRLWLQHPRLKGRTLWYRINGGRPEHVVNARGDMGDEANPPCPILTPNQWYAPCASVEKFPVVERGRAYCCRPPFVRWSDYADSWPRPDRSVPDFVYRPPVCFIHNLKGWGYGALYPSFSQEGVRVYGVGSPDGLVPHGVVPSLLSGAIAYVHLKSSDAPGYALYEALAAGCPCIVTRRLVWKERMADLFVEGETCLMFDRQGHQGLTAEDVTHCTAEVAGHLNALCNQDFNRRIGQAGRERLKTLLWSADRAEDVDSLRDFMRRNFP